MFKATKMIGRSFPLPETSLIIFCGLNDGLLAPGRCRQLKLVIRFLNISFKMVCYSCEHNGNTICGIADAVSVSLVLVLVLVLVLELELVGIARLEAFGEKVVHYLL
jgi:hypothetical protein